MPHKPSPKYNVTPRALEDLMNIGRYTEKTWGIHKRNAYLKEIEKCFVWLSKNPQLGKHRPEINNHYFSFPQGQHLIFYVNSNEHISIIGLPHKQMDITTYFERG